MKSIEVMITPDGKTLIQTQGFLGASCRQASKFLEEALGQRISESLTAQFYQQESAQRVARQEE